MKYHLLREFISLLLLTEDECNCPAAKEADKTHDHLLLEPDDTADYMSSRDEQAVVSSIAGVTTPLGTGPRYPSTSRRKKCKKCGKNKN